jgi:citrate lyase synthetase
LISKLSNNEIVALGGISKNNIKLINLTSSSGFAGISFFK